MKVLRSYQLSGDILRCYVDYPINEEQELPPFECSGFINLSAIVGPSAKRKDDITVHAVGVSRSVMLDEVIHFVQTIKQMYSL